MAAPVSLAVAYCLFLFLMININRAEDTRNPPTIFSKNDHDTLQSNPDSFVNQWEEDVLPKGEGHMRRSRDLNRTKNLKLRLDWFEPNSTKVRVGGEWSKDSPTNLTVLEELRLSVADVMERVRYDVQPSWVGPLQKYFNHKINLSAFDYNVGFMYSESSWNDTRVITLNLSDYPVWWKPFEHIYLANLIPDVSGEIIRATYKYDGTNLLNIRKMPVHLLGTTIYCDFSTSKNIEFFPKTKFIHRLRPIEVTHRMAVNTTNAYFDELIPLEITFTLTVQVEA